jgi:hypothetical protein
MSEVNPPNPQIMTAHLIKVQTNSGKAQSLETNFPSPFMPSPYAECQNSHTTNHVLRCAYCESDSDPDSVPPSPASIESLDAINETAWGRMRHERRRLGRNDPRHLTWKSNNPEIIAIVTSFFIFISFLFVIAYAGIKSYRKYESFEQYIRRGGTTC